MRWRVIGILMVAFALVLALGAVPAGAADVEAAASWAPWATVRDIVEYPSLIIIGGGYEWSYPDIDGNRVVYSERREDADGTGPGTAPGEWDLKLMDIRTGTKTMIASGAGNQYAARISGDWVVYVDDASGTDDVKAYNIASGAAITVAGGAGTQDAPDVSGSLCVYETTLPSPQARLYNLSTGADTLIAANGSTPCVSGNRVAYELSDDIRVLDLTNGSVIQVTNDATAQYTPRIDGDQLVYIQLVSGFDFDVVAYNISTTARKTVATDGTSYFCDISDGKAVWETYPSSGNPLIQAYDFATGKTVNIASDDTKDFVQPMISGNNVVFVNAADGSTFFAGAGEIDLAALAAPAFSWSVQAVDNYGAAPKITGKLTDAGVGIGSKTVTILTSTNGGHTWSALSNATTLADGSFTFTGPAAYQKAWFRVRFDGETAGFLMTYYLSRFSALSNVQSMTPRASVGKPTGYPASGSKAKYYSVYGSLKPRQTAAPATSKVVVVKCYRKNSAGKYVWKKTVNAKVYDYDTYSRYKASVKLPYAGTWRMRAYFKGSDINAAKYSSYRYVRVY